MILDGASFFLREKLGALGLRKNITRGQVLRPTLAPSSVILQDEGHSVEESWGEKGLFDRGAICIQYMRSWQQVAPKMTQGVAIRRAARWHMMGESGPR